MQPLWRAFESSPYTSQTSPALPRPAFARKGYLASAKLLLARGASPDAVDANGLSALHYAVGVLPSPQPLNPSTPQLPLNPTAAALAPAATSYHPPPLSKRPAAPLFETLSLLRCIGSALCASNSCCNSAQAPPFQRGVLRHLAALVEACVCVLRHLRHSAAKQRSRSYRGCVVTTAVSGR